MNTIGIKTVLTNVFPLRSSKLNGLKTPQQLVQTSSNRTCPRPRYSPAVCFRLAHYLVYILQLIIKSPQSVTRKDLCAKGKTCRTLSPDKIKRYIEIVVTLQDVLYNCTTLSISYLQFS